MIAKWLGLIEAGRIAASGGGSIPLGDATVWNSVSDWAGLGTLPTLDLRSGDQSLVISLFPGVGIAKYNGSDWELYQALFPTKADLEAFPELVTPGATAIVGTGVETDPIYYSDGTTWFRTPDGTRYIYPNELDWASLPTEDTIKADDEAVVASLGPGNAYGRAVYDGTDWLLSRAWFDTVADMTAFAQPKSVGALAAVEASASDDENAVRYQWTGSAWARTAALTAGYAWTLTESQALTGADPSGIGAVNEGDFGIVSASGGPILLRYKVVTIAPGAGSGTRALWIPPAAYAGTNLQIDSYAIGTESDPQLVTQGFVVVESVPGPGTVSSVGGYIRLDAPSTAPVSTNSIAQLTSPTITGAKKFWIVCEIRGTVSSINAAGGLFQSSSEAATQFSLGHGAGVVTTVQQLFLSGTPPTVAWNNAANTYTARGGGSAFPGSGSTPWLLMVETGAEISDLVTTRVDGAAYSSFRRNGDGATTASNFTFTPLAVGGNGVSAQIEIKNYFRLVWD
jgi:hypothetical protein